MGFEKGMGVPLVGRVRINFFLQMVSEQVNPKKVLNHCTLTGMTLWSVEQEQSTFISHTTVYMLTSVDKNSMHMKVSD